MHKSQFGGPRTRHEDDLPDVAGDGRVSHRDAQVLRLLTAASASVTWPPKPMRGSNKIGATENQNRNHD